MRVVGIRQLKAKLSEYLRDVRRGEVFLVTDRDEVVAELRPPGTLASQPDAGLDGALEKLVREGVVSSPRLDRADWTWRPQPLDLPEGTARGLLDALRSDRAGMLDE